MSQRQANRPPAACDEEAKDTDLRINDPSDHRHEPRRPGQHGGIREQHIVCIYIGTEWLIAVGLHCEQLLQVIHSHTLSLFLSPVQDNFYSSSSNSPNVSCSLMSARAAHDWRYTYILPQIVLATRNPPSNTSASATHTTLYFGL